MEHVGFVNIYGQMVEVFSVDDLEIDGELVDGYYCEFEQQIHIHSANTGERFKQFLVHEMVHALHYRLGVIQNLVSVIFFQRLPACLLYR